MEYSEDFPSFPSETVEDEVNDESLGLGFGHNDMIGGGKETGEDGEEWEEDDEEEEDMDGTEADDFADEEI